MRNYPRLKNLSFQKEQRENNPYVIQRQQNNSYSHHSEWETSKFTKHQIEQSENSCLSSAKKLAPKGCFGPAKQPSKGSSTQEQSSRIFIVQKYPPTRYNFTDTVKVTTSSIRSKLTRQAKKQENTTLKDQKNQTVTKLEMTDDRISKAKH